METLTISIVGYLDYDDISMAVGSIERYTPDTISKQISIADNAAAYDPVYQIYQDGFKKLRRLQKRKTAVCHEELNSLAECYGDIRLIACEKNLGFGAGHNRSIRLAQSRYHAIVNPDILIEEDVFSAMIAYMDAHPEVVMLTPRLVGTDGELLHVYRRLPTVFDCFIRRFLPGLFQRRSAYHTMQDQDYTRSFDVEFAQGSFMFVRTEALQEIGGFDERFFLYMEDADLCRRLSRYGRICYFPDVTVIHKWQRGSRRNLKLFLTHLTSLCRYFNKWGWKFL